MNFKQVIDNKIQLPEFMTNIIGEIPLIIKPLDGGHSSIVYSVKLHNGSSCVLKFSENTTELYNEQLFLKTWSQKGIRTPEIIELTQLPEGIEGSVLQMEFVSGQNLFPLMEKSAVDSPQILHDLGVILATMHTVTVTGYGTVNVDSNGSIQGEDKSFGETLHSLEWQETISIHKQNGNINDSLLDKAVALLENQALSGCLVHNDFRAGNILYDNSLTSPYAVIDPKATISHPYFCLAYSLILEDIHGKNDPIHFQQGYESISPLNSDVLHAALFLRALELLRWWGQPNKPYAKALRQLFNREKEWLIKYG